MLWILVVVFLLAAKPVSLVWDAPNGEVPIFYTIYRADNSFPFIGISTVTYPTNAYTDTAAPKKGKFCYAVTASYSAEGESVFSNIVCLNRGHH
jgi:fibronectin type 3 domain-containing protein